jgi:hypothetical protein
VTIPAYDFDAALDTEPTVWRERGLHYHAYSWRGDGKSMQDNETGRHDPATELPPVLIREWLRKPQQESPQASSQRSRDHPLVWHPPIRSRRRRRPRVTVRVATPRALPIADVAGLDR